MYNVLFLCAIISNISPFVITGSIKQNIPHAELVTWQLLEEWYPQSEENSSGIAIFKDRQQQIITIYGDEVVLNNLFITLSTDSSFTMEGKIKYGGKKDWNFLIRKGLKQLPEGDAIVEVLKKKDDIEIKYTFKFHPIIKSIMQRFKQFDEEQLSKEALYAIRSVINKNIETFRGKLKKEFEKSKKE